jgi:hypothetical protein
MWLERDNFSSGQMKRAYRDTYEARLPASLNRTSAAAWSHRILLKGPQVWK